MNETSGYLNAGVLSYDVPESICGKDTRYQVEQTKTVPYCYASHLRIRFAEGVFVGSAFPVLRSEKHLVFATSGHCVYANSKLAEQIELTPALNLDEQPYETITVESADLRAAVKWQAGGPDRSEFDYGAILAPAESGIGTMAMACITDDALLNRVISNCGYPADKPYGTMWWCGGPIETVEERMIRYMADTYGGQSGSPVYTWCDDNVFRAVGIHGYGGCPNGAVRITAAVMADFEAWANS